MALCGMAARIAYLKQQSIRDPLKYWRPTRPQKQWISDPAKIKCLAGGNQCGKTAAAMFLLVATCLGRHPTLKTDPPPIEAWLVTYSHAQSLIIQQKLYEMIPKDELDPTTVFVHGKGFKGLTPVIKFRNKSFIRVKTAQSGEKGYGLESGSVSLVVIDEPVSAHVFNQCVARTLRGGANGTRGTVAISMTPVGNVDVQYIPDMVAAGKCSLTRAPLTVQDTTPVDWHTDAPLQPLLSQRQIDEVSSSYLEIDRHQRITGSFEVARQGIVFTSFKTEMISSAPVPRSSLPHLQFCIGIDHGSQPNSQVCVLACIDQQEISSPKVWVLDEYTSGQAPPEHHVRAILEMLRRNGLRPEQVQRWTGDGTHHARRNRDGFKMSNIMLMRAFESICQYPPRQLPWTIRKPVKWRHSVYMTASLIHSCMSRQHFWVHPRCTQLIKSIKNWTMHTTQSSRSVDPHGHAIDALRYCIAHALDARPNRATHMQIRR